VLHPEGVFNREQQRHREEVEALRSDLRWMVDTATDEQLLAWVDDAGRHIAEMKDTHPDWIRRYADQLTRLQMRLDTALNDQEWDIKISKVGPDVQVVGTIPREQVPALLYRLAARYADAELGSSIEASLRFEVEEYLRQRNEAQEQLIRLNDASPAHLED
jgi:hypothetical protein